MSFTMLPATSASFCIESVGVRISIYDINNLRMNTKMFKAYKMHTFSLLERALLVSTLTFADTLFFRALVVEALAGAVIGVASASSDIWCFLFPLATPFLWACCSSGGQSIEAHRSAELLPLESSLISDIFIWGTGGSCCAGSRLLSLRTCCRRWVSLVWSCFWLTELEPGPDNVCAEDRRSCCCAKLNRFSKENK